MLLFLPAIEGGDKAPLTKDSATPASGNTPAHANNDASVRAVDTTTAEAPSVTAGGAAESKV